VIQSPLFWAVLGLSVPVFWLLPVRARPGFLAAVSFGYLVTLAPQSVCALAVWTLAFYYLGPQTVAGRPRRGALVTGMILAIVGYLAYFKYIPPLISAFGGFSLAVQLVIPLGISYYTFKLIHYVAEVARGNIQDRSLTSFLCYMLLFPIFTAGPIERFDHFLANREDRWRLDSTVEGLTRIVHGLIKKFVIAELVLHRLFGGVTNELLLAKLPELSTLRVWRHLAVSYLYLYMDFSAYTDLAIGGSRLFGLRIMENFNFPILARSIGDFWRRWHLTLSGWCQSYVYMPILGLYRKPFVALYASFIVFGLWHAGTLTRLLWGIYHATGVAIYMIWTRYKRKRGWVTPQRCPWILPGFLLTQAFMTASMALLIAETGRGAADIPRLFCKLFSMDLPN